MSWSTATLTLGITGAFMIVMTLVPAASRIVSDRDLALTVWAIAAGYITGLWLAGREKT